MDHEKLEVYRKALDFIAWVADLMTEVEGKAAVKDQLDRASTSVVLNIAEGNGKWSSRDRGRFLQIAAGSATECSACLDVLVAKRLAHMERVESGKKMLCDIAAMLVGLIQWNATRVREDSLQYGERREIE